MLGKSTTNNFVALNGQRKIVYLNAYVALTPKFVRKSKNLQAKIISAAGVYYAAVNHDSFLAKSYLSWPEIDLICSETAT